MKRVSLFIVFFLFAACTWNSLPVLADEILLKNGDRITGKILKKDNGSVSVETSYAGTIQIRWPEIERIAADQPLEVMLVNKTLRQATTFHPGGDGSGNGDNAVPLEEVQYINPPPHISGKGTSWRGRLDAGGAISEGNTETSKTRVAGEIVARTVKNRYTLASTFNYATDNDAETESNISGLFKADHFLSEKWYLTGSVSLLKDKYKDLNLRTQIGAGAGYQFKESRLLNLSAEAGIDYVKKDYIDSEDEEYPAARWAFNYDQYFFGEAVQFFHKHIFNVGLENTEDMYLKAQTGVRVPVIDNVNASFEIDVEWDNSPGEEKERTDYTYIFGLGYSF